MTSDSVVDGTLVRCLIWCRYFLLSAGVIFLGIVATDLLEYAREYRICSEIKAAGGSGVLGYTGPTSVPVVFQTWSPFFRRAVSVGSAEPMSQHAMNRLCQLKHVEYLMCPVGMRDSDVQRLCCIPQLETIDLRRTAVTDEGLLALASGKRLRVVNCMSSRVTSTGIEALKRILPSVEIYGDDQNLSKDGAVEAVKPARTIDE